MASKLKQSLTSAQEMESTLGNVLSAAVREATAPFQAKLERLEAENQALKARLSAFEARSELANPQETSGSEKKPADDAEEAQMVAVLRDFTPLCKLEAPRRLVAAPELKRSEGWVATSRASAESVAALRPLVAELEKVIGAAVAARLGEARIFSRCVAVVEEGNRDFRAVYNSMWTTIAHADAEGLAQRRLAAYAAAVAKLTDLPGAGAKQRAGLDVVALYEDAARAKPGFDALVEEIAARVPAIELSLPAGLKSTARIVEKSLFRVDAPPGTVDGVFDVVRGMLVAPSMAAVAAVVKAFGSNSRVVLTRVKNRYDDAAASAGGWRDLMLNFYLADDDAKHVCEVQVVHRQMLVARAGLSGHSVYNRVRNASELCEVGLATDAEARAGGFSEEALAIKKLLRAAADDDDDGVDADRRRCLQLHLDARARPSTSENAKTRREAEAIDAALAKAMKKGDVSRLSKLKAKAEQLRKKLAALQAGAPEGVARRLRAAGASVGDVYFAQRARKEIRAAVATFEAEGDAGAVAMLREKMAELRAGEALRLRGLIPDVVAAAGFAVPCYTASASGDKTAALLASASDDKTVRLWGVEDGERTRVLEGHSDFVISVAFAPGARPGEAALLASGSKDNTVRLWGVDDGECKRVLKGHSNTVYAVAFAPARPGEAALLASGSKDKAVRLWGVDAGECKRVLEGHSGEVFSVAFAPARPGEAALLASGADDKTIRLWGVADGGRPRAAAADARLDEVDVMRVVAALKERLKFSEARAARAEASNAALRDSPGGGGDRSNEALEAAFEKLREEYEGLSRTLNDKLAEEAAAAEAPPPAAADADADARLAAAAAEATELGARAASSSRRDGGDGGPRGGRAPGRDRHRFDAAPIAELEGAAKQSDEAAADAAKRAAGAEALLAEAEARLRDAIAALTEELGAKDGAIASLEEQLGSAEAKVAFLEGHLGKRCRR
ncbi:hypothetical protein SO694_000028100 [Aureococcus anophagefferens]|uniref:Uncharacterized protein n=1 Tax=Aureococcus anophagefferens TaxID=44056 RepID=A0ABR1GDG1_AURAN